MSNLTKQCVDEDYDLLDCCSAVELVIAPKDKDSGGFSVRRTLPSRGRRMVGPWVFFDHMGPAEFAPGLGINVRPHPHIGIATVTYLFDGEILHRDSVGSIQPIRPGDVNLMVAGKGIVHSERERPERISESRSLNGLQLWLALPEEQEQIDAAFYHYPAQEIPERLVHGVPVRVIMGAAYGLNSPVKLHSDTLYIEAHLDQEQKLTLPQAEELAVYVVQGEIKINDTLIPQHSMAFIKANSAAAIQALCETRIAMIGGERCSARFMEWNFVSSQKERIVAAKEDWQAGRFDKVIEDEKEFIPLPS